MFRRTILITLSCLALISLIAVSYLAANMRPSLVDAMLEFPTEAKDGGFWPRKHCWLWSIRRLAASDNGQTLSVVYRVVHYSLKPHESPSVGKRQISKSECDAEISIGKLIDVRSTDSALVSVQVIDLNEIGIPNLKSSLRLLLSLKIRGTTTSLSDNATEIDGAHIFGQFHDSEPAWENGELHLQSLFTRSENQVFIYDIVVVQSE